MAALERLLDGSLAQAPPRPSVPDDHAPRAIAGPDLTFEGRIVERVILDLHGEPLLARIGRRPLRNRPRLQHAGDLEPEVVVQRARRMLLDHVAQRTRFALALTAAPRLRALREVALRFVVGELAHGSGIPAVRLRRERVGATRALHGSERGRNLRAGPAAACRGEAVAVGRPAYRRRECSVARKATVTHDRCLLS